jgi:hypothetical protein
MGVQDLVVTLAALAAAGLVVKRLAGLRRPRRTGGPACPSCAAGDACEPAPQAAEPAPSTSPVTFYAPSRPRQ